MEERTQAALTPSEGDKHRHTPTLLPERGSEEAERRRTGEEERGAGSRRVLDG